MNHLTDNDRESIVNRILCGDTIFRVKSKLYKLVLPEPHINVLADDLYQDIIRKNRFNEWLDDADCLKILVNNELCSKDIDANLKEMAIVIEDTKINLYESLFMQDQFDITKKRLQKLTDRYSELIRIRHALDYITLPGYAENVRRQFLIYHTLYDYDNNCKVWNDWDEIDGPFITEIGRIAVANIIPISYLREIARTDPWKGHWNSTNGHPLKNNAKGYMSDEQRAVILFSHMYENIAKHPECPPDDIIDDDDLFDGWMIRERRKREKDQTTKQLDSRIGSKHAGADEIFLPARNAEQAQNIRNMNDLTGKIIVAQRSKQLENSKEGKVTDEQFLDRKLEIQQQSNKLFVSKGRG